VISKHRFGVLTVRYHLFVEDADPKAVSRKKKQGLEGLT